MPVSFFSKKAKQIRALKEEVRLLHDGLTGLQNKLEDQEQELEEKSNYIFELERNSITDPLTGVYNAQGFRSFVENKFPMGEKEPENERRESKTTIDPGVLVYVDLDNFKTINDTHGHAEGDKVIKLFAEFLTENFRHGSDIVARTYSGDEFCLYLHGSKSEVEVREHLRNVRESFKNLSEETWGYGQLSFSFGVCRNSTTLDFAMMTADARMQRDKIARKAHR